MGARKKAFVFSGVLIAASLVALFAFGLNQGIDFKGGSAVVATFEKGSMTDRGAIRSSVSALLESELGDVDNETSVQDFSTGVGSEITTCQDVPQADGSKKKECSTRDVDRFLIYTEVTTLINPEKRAAIVKAIQEKFGDKTRVQSREDSDTFYLYFDADTDILAREAALAELFKGLGYEHITATSDYEQQLEVEFLRAQDLARQDARATGGEDANAEELDAGPSQAEYDAKKAQELVGKTDKSFTVNVEELRGVVTARLAKDFPGKFITVESSMSVSPSVGKDLFNNGLLALLYAIIGILIYITVRFDFRYAPGAVVALIHDVTITMGIFAIIQVKFSLPIIAALLTIIGYSLNDTIVVMDRVRETFDTYRGQGMLKLLNRAINSTLSRTVLTSATTLFSVIAILVFGGGQIRDFALALFIGITIGTYSSIYIASPLVYYMDQYLERRAAQHKEDSRAGNNKPGGKSNRAKAAV
ncbi:MAG: protein translocase subunit SecF [Deltaproteobacteria bacterium]|nr:MAG: protein translocase subunit SecF [Deltaproteobacteria bacterium]